MMLFLQVPKGFHFRRTVFSHGWCALPPFTVDKETESLRRVVALGGGSFAEVAVNEGPGGRLQVEIDPRTPVKPADYPEISDQVLGMFRCGEDLAEFYREARRYPEFRWIPRAGAGRMLRAPTMFEDALKMMCTTNCSWSLTEIMVGNLCRHFGEPLATGGHAFPVPEAIAESSDSFIRKNIKAGYRSPYILEFAKRVVRKEVDPERWRSSGLPTPELFIEMRSVKGIGPYAAANLLKLAGRYDYLGIDSWCRKKFSELHAKNRKVKDTRIEKYYERFGPWRGLFFWLDVTKEWYDHKFPF